MAEVAPCPTCSTKKAKPIKFTWWGGALGPKLLSHVRCEFCGTAYNGKTGASNTKGIVIYSAVGCIIAFVLGAIFVVAMANK